MENKNHLDPIDLPDGTYPRILDDDVYTKVIQDWCKQVKSERSELTYSQKRDFLHMLGATVIVFKQEHKGAEPTWDIRVALPKVQEIIY